MLLGSLVASFIPGSDPKSLSVAVNTIISNPSALSDSTALSVNINGKTYSTSKSNSDNTDTTSSDYTATIVIVVVCVVVCAAIIFGVYFGITRYEKYYQRRLLMNESLGQNSSNNNAMNAEENAAKQSGTNNDEFKLKQRGLFSFRNSSNKVKPGNESMATTDRPPSGTVSVTMLNVTTDDTGNGKTPLIAPQK